MATLPVSSLVPYMRVMADDYNVSLQEYSDDDLITNLRVGIILQEAAWNHGYTIQFNEEDPDNKFYEIVGESVPEQWLQILFCLKTAMGMKAWQDQYSFNNKVVSVTNADQSQNKKTIKEFYDEILVERKNNCAGYAYSTWDDFFSRPNLILNQISEGFR
jgi:hypothetical protein